MRFRMIVDSLTNDDLVTIFSDAFYGSYDFALDYKRDDYLSIPEEKRTKDDNMGLGSCYESKCADVVLNGGVVYVTDNICGGEVYGKLPHIKNDNDTVTYQVNLNDILKGLSCVGAAKYVSELVDEMDDGNTGYCIIQFILFGELIYA